MRMRREIKYVVYLVYVRIENNAGLILSSIATIHLCLKMEPMLFKSAIHIVIFDDFALIAIIDHGKPEVVPGPARGGICYLSYFSTCPKHYPVLYAIHSIFCNLGAAVQ